MKSRWVMVPEAVEPTAVLLIGEQAEQWVRLADDGFWVRWRRETWHRAEPGEVPPRVGMMLRGVDDLRGVA